MFGKSKKLIYKDGNGNKFYCGNLAKYDATRKVKISLVLDELSRGISNDDLHRRLMSISRQIENGELQAAIQALFRIQLEISDCFRLDLLSSLCKCVTFLNDEPKVFDSSSQWSQEKERIFSTDDKAYYFMISWTIDFMQLFPEMVKEEIKRALDEAIKNQK